MMAILKKKRPIYVVTALSERKLPHSSKDNDGVIPIHSN